MKDKKVEELEDRWIDEDRDAVLSERYGAENLTAAKELWERATVEYLTNAICSITQSDKLNEWNTFNRFQLTRLIKAKYSSFKNFKNRELESWLATTCEEGFLYPPVAWLFKYVERNWDLIEKMSIKEMFEEQSDVKRAVMFRFLSPQELMIQLGAERIMTEGIEVKYETGEVNNNIYELYRAESSKIEPNLTGYIYAVKCWCTSTNKEAWLWVENEEYACDPLTAIASTFRVPVNVIPHIKGLKRQGDVLMAVLDQVVTPGEEERPLTKEEYFSLLRMEA